MKKSNLKRIVLRPEEWDIVMFGLNALLFDRKSDLIPKSDIVKVDMKIMKQQGVKFLREP